MKIRNNKNNNKKNAKKALALSLMSGALCFAMLAGSTYAWFTDSASGSNLIATGNLDVELLHMTEGGATEKVEAGTKLFQSAAPVAEGEEREAIKWEPGAVAYETFVVENKGTLNLTFDFLLNSEEDGVWYTTDIEAGTKDKDYLKNYLQVAILPATDTEGNIVAPRITRGADGKIYVGAEGSEQEITGWKTLAATEKEQDALEAGESTAYTVVVYWEPISNNVDNRFNMNNGGKMVGGDTFDQATLTENSYELTLGIELNATQHEGDYDGIGNDYDNGARQYMIDNGVSEDEYEDPLG